MKPKISIILLLLIVLLSACGKITEGENNGFPSGYDVELYTLPSIDKAQISPLSFSYLVIALIEYNQYDEVMNLLLYVEDQADVLNQICWAGALDGYYEMVMEACNKAVVIEPDQGAFRDSRGLARALSGDINGAIEDFSFFILWYETLSESELNRQNYSDEMVTMRIEWIQKLKDGISPFDDIEIATLLVNEYSNYLEDPFFLYFSLGVLSDFGYFEYASNSLALISRDIGPENLDIQLFNYFLCIRGSIYGAADTVSNNCDNAADSTSVAGVYNDARGISRAISGDIEGALADFKEYINLTETIEQEELLEYYPFLLIPTEDIQRWIENLQNNIYPFTEEDFIWLYASTQLE